MREEILRRLLVSKHLLASTGGLTPYSDPTSVGRAILTAHDASELALAAIADHLHAEVSDRIVLTEYPEKIRKASGAVDPFPGSTFISQLNKARTGFKHAGIFPDPRQWYRVIENTWDWLDQWCALYLGARINEIDVGELLEHTPVRDLYGRAKTLCGGGHYKESLELLGNALLLVLKDVPRVVFPVVGPRHQNQPIINQALHLTAFGVNPSDFLTTTAKITVVLINWLTPFYFQPRM
jgi:hypothetical protein